MAYRTKHRLRFHSGTYTFFRAAQCSYDLCPGVTEYPHIFWNEDKNLPCLEGTRLRVQDVVANYLVGRSVEEIQEAYPSYTLAQILSALAYYYDHQNEMDRQMEERRRMAEEALAEIEARQGPSPLREKLRGMKQRT